MLSEELKHRTFSFHGHSLHVTCRQSPEELGVKTLTWQDAQDCEPADQAQQQGGDLVGLDLWPASIALCQYLAAHPQLVVGLSLLELGAGTGLPGLLAAKLGARSVTLTDNEPLVLEQLMQSAERNGVACICSTQQLDWLHITQLPTSLLGCWRRLLAADVLYASRIVQPFVGALAALLGPEGVALMAHQVRRAILLDKKTGLPRLEDKDEPFEAFLLACQSTGLHVRIISSRETCSNVDQDPMLLVAVGREQEPLQRLPGWEHGSDSGGEQARGLGSLAASDFDVQSWPV